MDTSLSILSPSHTFFTRLHSLKPSLPPLLHHLTQTLGFCFPKPPPPNLLRFRVTFQSPSSAFPAKSQLSDADDDEEEDDFEEDDDEDVAADEYDDISGDMSDGLEQSEDEIERDLEPAIRADEEFRWQRVEKLCDDVKQFGEEMIDDAALASLYDFRIDKFQRLAIQAFLRGSLVVVSAPTSSGKTLIAEAAAVATVAKGRRLFYTTPLKALSNQKFREFRKWLEWRSDGSG